MLKNRFYKQTLGVHAEIVIASALETEVDHKTFVSTATAGSVQPFWSDTGLAVAAGQTALAANVSRKFFYAYKDLNGVSKKTCDIPCSSRTYTSAPYTAGQPDILTVQVGGTVDAGQTIHVKIIDATYPQNVPAPFYAYEAKVSSTVTAAVAAIAAQINAEKGHDKIFTATAAGDTLTVTGTLNRNLKVAARIETTVAKPNDASAIVVTHTQKSVYPLGTYADILELQRYAIVANGGSIYSGSETINVAELQDQSGFTASTGINYGHLIVGQTRWEKGETRNYDKKMYVIVALPTASLATLAGF